MSTENGQKVFTEIIVPAKEENHEPQYCIRQGCIQKAIKSPEWEDEYCSAECVVAHCKTIFTEWCRNAQKEADQKENNNA